jgi:aldose 1-epimerase
VGAWDAWRALGPTIDIDGFTATVLRAGDLSATFVPGAGMIGVSLHDGDDELLGQRRGLASYVRDAKTMGIPLLHPWANRLGSDDYRVGDVEAHIAADAPHVRRDGNGLPIHGLLAGSPDWEVESVTETALVATFDFSRPDLLASFPFPHRLRIAVSLQDRTLGVRTTLSATGDRPVPVAYGFHPYLRLPEVPRADWRIELPALRALALDDRGIPTGASTQAPASASTLGGRAYDDAFDGVEPGARFAVVGGGRRIVVDFETGFSATQVFAPLTEDVICFEPMTAPTNALVSGVGLRVVEPGAHDVSAFSITV